MPKVSNGAGDVTTSQPVGMFKKNLKKHGGNSGEAAQELTS